jgi:hypothetical protein
MAGYNSVISLRRLEEDLDKLGLMLCASKHSSWGNTDYQDIAAVKPKDEESLPIYVRDAEIFSGSLEQIRTWLHGVTWARTYDGMLNLSNEKKREKKENDYRAKRMLKTLAGEENEKKIDK